MRFLADMGVSMTTVRVLQEHGHEVIHLRTGGYGRLSDAEILDKAGREKCVVLTFDLDFGDLLASTIQSLPSVIIFRMRNQTPASVTPRLLETLSSCSQELSTGAIVIVEDTRYRLRRLPIDLK
jgi:predicted nuclease of predicted toxin-antitoxin system